MTPKELKAIAKEMRKLGITHLKTDSFDITLSPETPKAHKRKLSNEEEKVIKHKVEQYKSVMALDDAQLIDRLFPDHTQPEETDEAH